ncbi:hypothetical protein [Lewinella sp. IMCC34191]|uniref:hypothetical protein n=1 Tax=Lewinella sp. IMCC34191 TaxID=2259172 RepID=UPI001300457A|nr:hypothetical protein [Lewinella sp. IMCC34191]
MRCIYFVAAAMLSLSLSAQLKRGDRLVGFGQHVAFQNVAYDIALDDGLLAFGSASGTNNSTVVFSLPNHSFMLTDWLQLGLSMRTEGHLSLKNKDYLGLGIGLRGYLLNSPRGGLYLGGDYLNFSGYLVGEKNVSAFYPNGGVTIPIGDAVQLSNELGFLVANRDFPSQMVFSVQLAFRLSPTKNEALANVPDVKINDWMFGTGSLSFSRVSSSGVHQLVISPEAHYFATPTTAFGLRGKYQRVPANNRGFSGEATAWGAGFTLRQFFHPLRRQFVPFAQLGMLHNWLKEENRYYGYYGSGQIEARYFSFDAAIGALIFLRPSIALEMGVGYGTLRGEGQRGVNNERSISLTFGGRFFISKE